MGTFDGSDDFRYLEFFVWVQGGGSFSRQTVEQNSIIFVASVSGCGHAKPMAFRCGGTEVGNVTYSFSLSRRSRLEAIEAGKMNDAITAKTIVAAPSI